MSISNRSTLCAAALFAFYGVFAARAEAADPNPAAEETATIPVQTLPETPAAAEPADKAVNLETVQVTATKTPTPVETLPASVTIVTGEELRALHANDLRSALALVAGVEVGTGGDGGPASSVPAIWGLREFDAFLLVVDGVPSGGAFNPALATLDLHNVERIEVQRGAAPVMYGATSFVGVIQVIHYAAGESDHQVQASFGGPEGRYKSGAASGSLVLSEGEGIRQTVSADVDSRALSDPQAGFKRSHALYRLGGDLFGGKARFDADYSQQHQRPTSPHPGLASSDNGLDPNVKLDANFNPSDARLNNDSRYQPTAGYNIDTALGNWESTFSYTFTKGHNIRGFLAQRCANHSLQNSLIDQGHDNACGYDQQRRTTDGYGDTHLVSKLLPSMSLTTGADYLYGRGSQAARVFSYTVDSTNGGNAPPSGSATTLENNSLTDTRYFFGLYTQLDWHLLPSLDLLLGARYNGTRETRAGNEVDSGARTNAFGQVVNIFGFENDGDAGGPTRNDDSHKRGSGTAGLSWRFWQAGRDDLTTYINYRNAFKPAAIDFGPEAESDLLNPETSQSYETGLKSALLDGRLTTDFSVFYMRMKNIVVPMGTTANGVPTLINGGTVDYRGAEIETRFQFVPHFYAVATAAYHDLKYVDTTRSEIDPNGVDPFDMVGLDMDPPQKNIIVDISGNRREFTPRYVGSLGLVYAPAHGFNAAGSVNYSGSRYLDETNSTKAKGFTVLDLSAGYRFNHAALGLTAHNLTDRRDAVSGSELGAGSYYRNPARSIEIAVTWPFN